MHRATGGVGNSGYLEGTRPDGFAPAFNPGNAPASAAGLGNLGALYGPVIEIAWYGRIFAMGGDQPILHLFASATSGTNWRKEVVPASGLDPFRADWTRGSVVIDTRWTDAEAMAAGWVRLAGAAAWTDVLADVTAHHPFYGYSNGDATAGLDNVSITTVPLPAPALLLAAALVPLVARRCR